MAETETTSGASDTTQPPTPSLLLYLFADQVLPKSLMGTKAPLADVKVPTANLARELFAVAFWHLRESGLVRLDLSREKVLFMNVTHLRVTRTGDGPRDSLEGAILRHLTGNPKQDTVKEIVRRWYGKDVSAPESYIPSAAEREGVAKGYIDVVDAHRNVVAAALIGKTQHVPNRDKILTLEPAFTEIFTQWKAFRAREPELAKQLDSEVGGAIKSRREASDTGD